MKKRISLSLRILPLALALALAVACTKAPNDAQGRLSFRLPFSGSWLLRGTLIEPDGPDRWKSRFVTPPFDAQ